MKKLFPQRDSEVFHLLNLMCLVHLSQILTNLSLEYFSIIIIIVIIIVIIITIICDLKLI